jgi:hypothetical protein
MPKTLFLTNFPEFLDLPIRLPGLQEASSLKFGKDIDNEELTRM